MIQLAITDAKIRTYSPSGGSRVLVVHPQNDAILAYCDTEAEARMVREIINDMPRLIRENGARHDITDPQVR